MAALADLVSMYRVERQLTYSPVLFQILQNLGKADRTTDEVFDDYVHNFSRQQGQATRLQKEMANYVRCARGKSMRETGAC